MPVNSQLAVLLGADGETLTWLCASNNKGLAEEEPVPDLASQVVLQRKMSSVSAGEGLCIGIASDDGSLWSWELGRECKIPTQIPSVQNFVQVSVGGLFFLALDKDKSVWSYGKNDTGQLGIGYDRGKPNYYPTLTKISSLSNISQISAGHSHSIVLDCNGDMWSFGRCLYGELGLGQIGPKWSPCKIERVGEIVQVSCGYFSNLALDALGQVWSFGSNSSGQLGDGSRPDQLVPQKIITQENIIQVYCGGWTSYIVDADHRVFVFGESTYREFGLDGNRFETPTEQESWFNNTIIPGAYHTLVVDEEGNLFFHGVLFENTSITFHKPRNQQDLKVAVRNNRQLVKRATT